MIDDYVILLLVITLLLIVCAKYIITNLVTRSNLSILGRLENISNINYFVNYYVDKDHIRQKEIDKCLENNINNIYINNIYIIGTKQDIPNLQREILDNRIHFIINDDRPTFNYFFKMVNKFTKGNDINIMANSDIYFDHSIKYLPNYFNNDNVCLALSRWDILPNSEVKHYDVYYSQDTWVFKGKIKSGNIGNYYLGTLACDNKIVRELLNIGYFVKNPSKTIRTYHLHLSNVKNNNNNNNYVHIIMDFIRGNYAFVKPSY